MFIRFLGRVEPSCQINAQPLIEITCHDFIGESSGTNRAMLVNDIRTPVSRYANVIQTPSMVGNGRADFRPLRCSQMPCLILLTLLL